MRLDVRERPSCVKEAEVSRSSPFMKTAGKTDCRVDERPRLPGQPQQRMKEKIMRGEEDKFKFIDFGLEEEKS